MLGSSSCSTFPFMSPKNIQKWLRSSKNSSFGKKSENQVRSTMKKRSWSKVEKIFDPLWRAQNRIPGSRPQDVHSGTKNFFPSFFFVPLWRSRLRGRLLFFVYLSQFWIFFGDVRGENGQLDEQSNFIIECSSRSCLVWEVHYAKTKKIFGFFLSSPYCTSETKRNPEKKSVTKVVDFVEANIVCSCISEKYSILGAIISSLYMRQPNSLLHSGT